MPKVRVSEISVGNHAACDVGGNKDVICYVIDTQHSRTGKGGGYVTLTVKDINNQTKYDIRFSSSDFIHKAIIEELKCHYLYHTGDLLVVDIDGSTAEYNMEEHIIPEKVGLFLEYNMEIALSFIDNELFKLSLPKKIKVMVCSEEYGQRQSGSGFKRVRIKGDIYVSVPEFLSIDDHIIINTDDFSYHSVASGK